MAFGAGALGTVALALSEAIEVSQVLHVLSSMAPFRMLDRAASGWARTDGGGHVEVTPMGGVSALRMMEDGAEGFDAVVLAAGAIGRLVALQRFVPLSRVDVAVGRVAAAVPAGCLKPDLSTEASVRDAVVSAERIGYSTGPSGTAMLQLFERWGIQQRLQGRLVQAEPGVPVGHLVSSGEATLGFQQLSELIHVDGIDVAGVLPREIEVSTTFSAAIPVSSESARSAMALLEYLASGDCAAVKYDEGFDLVDVGN